jgi:zinc transporter 5/7
MAGLLPKHVQDLSSQGYSEPKPALRLTVKLGRWMKTIFSEKATRNLFLFLVLNLSFAFVELFWGMLTNSLGLISDSFHMFFDCTALLAGLVATVVARWSATERFTYGYVRAEVVAGFVNTLFLLFVAFFIFAEAIERSFEPPTVSHDRLMAISVAGFVVNLIGLFAFQHGGAGHGHSHGGGHGHSHGGGHSHTHDFHNSHDSHSSHSHSHSGSHSDLGGSKIMQGIFLHILADTLGSVGVIISSALIDQFGWMIADPICSMFIAVLIIVSIVPLMKDSLGVLMQRSPSSLDYTLPTSLQRVYELEGVVQVHNTHFWTLCTGNHHGTLILDVMAGTDWRRTISAARAILIQAGLTQVTIELNQMD